jgi:NAD(P)H-hydrate repair Nnr-like enzyme with NAD(P)H-hydrate epimerase domain
VPLGYVAHGRCGDKGGNSNVGFWPVGTSEEAWAWLRGAVSTDWIAEVYPGVEIERHEFPGLRAVHLVIHGILGKGASSNGRPDIAGKAVAEFLRARHVDVPTTLLAEVGREGTSP